MEINRNKINFKPNLLIDKKISESSSINLKVNINNNYYGSETINKESSSIKILTKK